MTILDDLSTAIRTVHESAGPAVVGIGRRIRGSGAVIAPNRVLTNAHNLRGEEVTVTFADGRSVTGRVLGVDGDGDLAVVDAETGSAPALAWSATAASVGDIVFGLAPAGPGGVRVTAGTVSAIGQSFRGPAGSRIGGSLEHTAPLAPGSSGGPLVDGHGRLLAINTNRVGEGFYLARPADAALQTRVAALARGESLRRPRLGMAVAPSAVARRLRRSVGLGDRDGLLVRGVEDGSPAAAAGIREGDLLVEAAGRPLAYPDTLPEVLAATGLPIELRIVRGDEERMVTVEAVAGDAGSAPEAAQ